MSITQLTGKDPRQLKSLREHELALKVEAHVTGMAHGRIRDLRVVCLDGVIIIQGTSRTQHDKQLAQEAALTVADRHLLLANQIVVSQ